MNQTTRQGVTITLLLAALIGLGALSGNIAANVTPRGTQSTPTPLATNVDPISYKGEEGKTVLQLLKEKHTAQTQDSSFGTYVTSINGIPSTETTAWLYYIDGQLGQEAADKAVTNANQTIEWRYESF